MGFPILICDDSLLARKVAHRALPADWDVTVTFACNGLEAVQALRQQHYGLLLLDLTMPEMDGIEVLKTINREQLEVFVVVISGDIQPQMRERVMQLGALEFIPKPVYGERLAQVLRDFGLYSSQEATEDNLSYA